MTAPAGDGQASLKRPRSTSTLVFLAFVAFLLFAGFTALGVWQLQRRAWKLNLIAEVNARTQAPAGPAPGPGAWASLTKAKDAYRHVQVRGRLLNDRETLVQAVTDYGSGDWVMTPLVSDQGFMVLVNRGFVPDDHRDRGGREAGEIAGATTVTGLLRLTEPHGGFLQANDPAQDRWLSRDVAAIAAKRRLDHAAPYFIDADSTPNPGGLPIGGLTVIRFPNSHLIYAITWFGMAGLVLVCVGVFVREQRRGGSSAR